jgi:hypothetical protein
MQEAAETFERVLVDQPSATWTAGRAAISFRQQMVEKGAESWLS